MFREKVRSSMRENPRVHGLCFAVVRDDRHGAANSIMFASSLRRRSRAGDTLRRYVPCRGQDTTSVRTTTTMNETPARKRIRTV